MIRLVIGGARSGKSTFAEGLYKGLEDVVYIATAKALDQEMAARISHHRASRPSYWRTFEETKELTQAIGEEKHYLLDCVTILVSNVMFDITGYSDQVDDELSKKVEDHAAAVLTELMDEIDNRGLELVLVTNEVGLSIVPENQIARVFRDIQGRINQRLAKRADEVYLVCAGIPVKIK